jgi:putative ABC transport system permease protein
MRWYQRFFRRGVTEKHLDAELRFHLEQQIADYISAGMKPEDARRRARLEFGGMDQVKEECRDVGVAHLLEILVQDLRYGLRLLAKNPGFSAVVVITLGLGIGLNSGIFSIVNGLLIREPPVKDPRNLMTVMTSNPAKGWPRGPASAAEFSAWWDQNHVFEDISAGALDEANLTAPGEPLQIAVARVTPNFFETFGVPPIIGHTFSAVEKLTTQESDTVISFELWQRMFNADVRVIGKVITLDGRNYTVIGVMPRQFPYVFPCDAWVAASFTAEALHPKEQHERSLNVFVRLPHGAGAATKGQAEISTILQRLSLNDPEEKGWTARLLTLRDLTVDKNTQTTMAFLMGMVGFVLLIAGANVAGIYLARSATRQQEFAVRSALGARRARLVQQLLAESLVLALLGGALGLLLTLWFVKFVRSRFSFSDYAAWLADRMRVDHSVLLFTLAISVLTVFLFALLPALQISKPDIQTALKESARSASTGPRQSRIRSAFVVAQIIFTMVLMAGAGTLIQGILAEMMPRLGFRPEHVLTVDLSLPSRKYAEAAKQVAFFRELLDRSKSLPGVQFSAVVHGLPEGWLYGVRFEVEGEPTTNPEERPQTFLHAVSSDYFHAMAIPLLKGRSFAMSDTTASAKVVIVNEAFVKRFYPKTDPVGARLRMYKTDPGSPSLCEIVGIAGNVKEHLGDSDNVLQMYVPYVQSPTKEMTLVLRTNANAAPTASAVRAVVWAIDKDQPIRWLKTMAQVIDLNGAGDRFIGQILGAFTAMALLLSGIGIYGVVSYLVAQRTHEFGLRMALGAGKQQVLRLVLRSGAILSAVGIAVGFVLSYPIPRILLSAYGESDTSIRNSLILVIAPVLVTAVALFASYIPARRATKVDPMVALRYE